MASTSHLDARLLLRHCAPAKSEACGDVRGPSFVTNLSEQLLPEIGQPDVESGGREDRGDSRQGPDSAKEYQQHVHVLDLPPQEYPTHADQSGAH